MNALALCICWITVVAHSFPIKDEEEAALYLQKFGYFDESNDNRMGAVLSREAISHAIKDFQRFAGLNQTGELDKSTIAMMKTPRCGMKDKIDHSESTRKKRYVLQGSKWGYTQLTYRITKYPTRLRDRMKVDKEIARAFKIWSDVTNMNFEERKTGHVTIDIRFENGEHGDGNPFDGPGQTLAHAFYPKDGGDAHFDDEEMWTIDERTGTNLFQVAAHEFGHSLGLSHSDEKGALMVPYYTEYQSPFKMHIDDILAIQALYGSSGEPVAPKDDQPLSPPADLCKDASIDAVTRTQDGNTYVFKGDFYWKILSNGIADGYPRRISKDWNGLEGNLDAALTWPKGKTIFFKGGRYWSFTNKQMDSGYPKLLNQGFEGIPNMLDAALVWSGNGKTYFFKGDKYWRYPADGETYPKQLSLWKGLPADGIDAALQWENNRTYFFKGDKYYRFNDISSEVDPEYPLSTSVLWFGCKSASDGRNKATSDGSSSDAPNLCQDASIDAVTRTQDGSTYVFKGEFYWKILSTGIAHGYPRRISEDWNGLEGNLDAALTWSNGKTFFFKGERYWSFTNKQMDSSYPRLLNQGFAGIPNRLDAALVWSGNGKTYFFKGDKYWRYPADGETYPKPLSLWKGLPADGIDAALQWENNRTYFFKGNKYYRFNDTTSDVDKEYPLSTSVLWFGCKSA